MKRANKDRSAFTRRALIIGAGQGLVFGGIASRLYNLQITQHSKFSLLAAQNSISERLVAPVRGLLTDRSGVILAGNQQHWRVLFMQALAPDPQAVLDNFYKLVPLPDDEKARIAQDVQNRPAYIPVLLKDWLDWPDMAAIEVNTPDLPGVVVEAGASRIYPLGPTTAHIVGYVGRPSPKEAKADTVLALPGMRVGRTGAEAAEDTPLRGMPGFVQTETNVHGEVVRNVAQDDGTPGSTVQLTLDAGLQQLAVQRLGDDAGAIVMLDATNGEILALVSTPSFDPSLFDKGVPATTWAAWMNDPKHPLQNKATSGLFAPGSTFKPTVALTAMKAGALSPTTILTCTGSFTLGDHIFWCDNHVAHGSINVRQALQVSCDVFFYQVALMVGIDKMADMAHTMGLGTDLGSDLPNIATGLVPTLDWARRHGIHWAEGSTVVQGIGQGYTTLTPIALATMIARLATANAISPHITRRIGDELQDGSDPDDWPDVDVDPDHLAAIRAGLFDVVNTPQGTAYASRLTLPGVQMAGKTGTAQTHNNTAAEKQKNFNDMTLAWELRPNALFVGYAPADNPRYAIAVVVEHGNFGAQSAAPVAHDLMTYALTNNVADHDNPNVQMLQSTTPALPVPTTQEGGA